MDIFLQQVVNGLTLGSVYAVVALGYTMVYGIIQLINFAHGELVMIGAMVAFTVINLLAAEGLLCSQAGIPVAAADKGFLEAYKKKFNVDPILYAPFTYDAANLLIAAMKKADSPDPAKYLPELAKITYKGATGEISFDAKGDRKDAEMTIFTMQGGKIVPLAVIKGGKTIPFAEFGK